MAAAERLTEVIKNRLVTKETTVTKDSSIWDTAAALLELSAAAARAANAADTPEEVAALDTAYHSFMKELSCYEIMLSRCTALQRRCEIDGSRYQVLHADIDQQMTAVKGDIATLRAELQAAVVERHQREQYEELASVINRFAPREDTQKSIDALSGEIATLQAEMDHATAAIDQRSKQFAALLRAVYDLQQSFDEEVREAEERTAAAAVAAAAEVASGDVDMGTGIASGSHDSEGDREMEEGEEPDDKRDADGRRAGAEEEDDE